MKDDLAESDELWRLLLHAKEVNPSPFFARNVLRAVRNTTPAQVLPRFLLPLIQAAALSLLLIGFTMSLAQPRKSEVPAQLVKYFDIAAGLDQVAFNDNF